MQQSYIVLFHSPGWVSGAGSSGRDGLTGFGPQTHSCKALWKTLLLFLLWTGAAHFYTASLSDWGLGDNPAAQRGVNWLKSRENESQRKFSG